MKKQTVRLLALLLLSALLLVTAVSCQFPFDLRMEENTSQPSSTEVPSLGSGEAQTEGTAGDEDLPSNPSEAPSEQSSEQPSDELKFVSPNEEASEGATLESAVPETDSALGVSYDVSPIVDAVMPAMVAI